MLENFHGKILKDGIENISIKVDGIDLMKSEHVKGKLMYSRVYSKYII